MEKYIKNTTTPIIGEKDHFIKCIYKYRICIDVYFVLQTADGDSEFFRDAHLDSNKVLK